MDELFGANYKHRTLRTIFDPCSNEWSETNIDEKKSMLKKIFKSRKITLNKLIRALESTIMKSIYLQNQMIKIIVQICSI